MLLALAALATLQPTYLIRGAEVLDGTGSAAVRKDIRISGKTIAAIGTFRPLATDVVINANGLMAAPGFIDAHSHTDVPLIAGRSLESQVRQGITTAIVGQDGGGATPVSQLFSKITLAHPEINFAAFCGQGVIRSRVLKQDFKRKSTPTELRTMCALVQEDMDAGALGLSTGLEYDPGYYSNTDEIVAMAKVAARNGGMYISHMRDEGNNVIRSVQELIRIAKEAHLAAQISHIKLATTSVWGKAREVCDLVDRARKSGLDVTADIYPYTFWQSTIRVLTLERNYEDRNVWQRALEDVGGAKNVLVTDYSPNPAWVGKTLVDISKMSGKDPISVIQEIIRNTTGPNGGSESIACTAMAERDMELFMKQSWVMFCSDGRAGGTHPRGAGAFPRVLAEYMRKRRVLTLPDAIHKMTQLPAQRFGLTGRGILRVGAVADVVLFSSREVRDVATPQSPATFSKGISYVFVSGVPVLINGKVTGSHPGAVILRQARGRSSSTTPAH